MLTSKLKTNDMAMKSFDTVLVVMGTWADGAIDTLDETVHSNISAANRVAIQANAARHEADLGMPLVHYKPVTLKEYLIAYKNQAEQEGYRQGSDS
jgi:hypothetical protein